MWQLSNLPSERSEIKNTFDGPDPQPITLFFPPKWGINDKLPKHPVLGAPARPTAARQVTLGGLA